LLLPQRNALARSAGSTVGENLYPVMAKALPDWLETDAQLFRDKVGSMALAASLLVEAHPARAVGLTTKNFRKRQNRKEVNTRANQIRNPSGNR